MLFQVRLRLNGGVSVDDIDSKCLATVVATAAATSPGAAEKASPPAAFGSGSSFVPSQGQHASGAAAATGPGDDDDEML